MPNSRGTIKMIRQFLLWILRKDVQNTDTAFKEIQNTNTAFKEYITELESRVRELEIEVNKKKVK